MPRFMLLAFSLLAILPSVGAWDNLTGGDHGGQDWIITTNTTIAENHYNIRLFKIVSGVTVTVQPYNGTSYGRVEIHAENIVIEGTLSANGSGYQGVTGEVNGNGPGYGTSSANYGGGGGGGYWAGAGGQGSSYGGGGGGCGGAGGQGNNGGAGGGACETFPPVWMGSSGGGGYCQYNPRTSGSGGGIIRLYAAHILISGVVSSDGLAGQDAAGTTASAGGGSGGAAVICGENIVIGGTVSANGGKGGNGGTGSAGAGAGGGSGGVIWVEGENVSCSGTLRANGGAGGDATYDETANDVGGGGGGGGWIQITATSWFLGNPSLQVSGGPGGTVGTRTSRYGAPGQTGKIKIVGGPRLLTPENEALVSGDVGFSWSPSRADNFRLLVSLSEDFGSPVADVVLPGSSTTFFLSLPPATYFWKVRAVRTSILGENSDSKVSSFRIPTWLSLELWSGAGRAPAEGLSLELWTMNASSPAPASPPPQESSGGGVPGGAVPSPQLKNIDNIPPYVRWLEVGGNLKFECWDESGIASVELWIDHERVAFLWNGRIGEVRLENLAEGPHTAVVRVQDNCGNENVSVSNFWIRPPPATPPAPLPPVVSPIHLSGDFLLAEIANRENRSMVFQIYVYVDENLFMVVPVELSPLQSVSTRLELKGLLSGDHWITIRDNEGSLLGSCQLTIPTVATAQSSEDRGLPSSHLFIVIPPLTIFTGALLGRKFVGRRRTSVTVRVEEIPEVARALAPLLKKKEKND